MEITGARNRKIYALVQIAYAVLVLFKLGLSYETLHITEIAVYGIFIGITPITMKALLSSAGADINEYFRLLLYGIVEFSYLTDDIGLIVANFIPCIFIITSFLFFTLAIKLNAPKRPYKASKVKLV